VKKPEGLPLLDILSERKARRSAAIPIRIGWIYDSSDFSGIVKELYGVAGAHR